MRVGSGMGVTVGMIVLVVMLRAIERACLA